MKHFTLQMFATVVAVMVTGAVQAQSVTFVQDRDARDAIGWPSHRAVPVVADWNGDGIMDAYYGGTSCTNNWQVRGVLVKGLGNGTYASEIEPLLEDYEDQERMPETDEEGNPLRNDNDEIIYQTDETGEYIWQTVTRQRVVGMKSGLPYSAYGMASQTLDFDQDGLVDLLIQNIGGNDTDTDQALVLVRNKGDYTFSVVNDSVLASLTMNSAGEGWNEGNEWGAVAVGDYDNDGYPDILYQTWGWNRADDQWRRDVALLHNCEGKGFEMANVFRPLPADMEPNRLGLYVKEADVITIDEDGVEIIVPGEWTTQTTNAIKRMSNGNVCFIDLNNDGWQDIVVTGWADGDDTERGGYELRYYENTRDGWFQDATDKLIASIEGASSVTDVWDTWGGTDNIITVIDYDQDGCQDLLLMGSAVNREGKQAYVLYNRGEGAGNVLLQEYATNLVPQSGLGCRTFLLADFNGDDVCDNFTRGWTNYADRNDWTEAICISKGIDDYDITLHGHESNWSGAYIGERTTSFGDLNADGKLDVVATGWTEKQDDFIPSYNTTDFAVSAPSAPEGVSAKMDEAGNLVVTWEYVQLSTFGEALYNVYVKNNATGALRQVVPANLATGAQLGYSRFGAYVPGLGGSGAVPTKLFAGLPDGSYTVGVQAVTYSYAASPFTTATVDIDNGIVRVKADKARVYQQGNMLTVQSNDAQMVEVFNAAGQRVASGVAGVPIAVPLQGVCIVRCGTEAVKVSINE